jgi:hypothetical protein
MKVRFLWGFLRAIAAIAILRTILLARDARSGPGPICPNEIAGALTQIKCLLDHSRYLMVGESLKRCGVGRIEAFEWLGTAHMFLSPACWISRSGSPIGACRWLTRHSVSRSQQGVARLGVLAHSLNSDTTKARGDVLRPGYDGRGVIHPAGDNRRHWLIHVNASAYVAS